MIRLTAGPWQIVLRDLGLTLALADLPYSSGIRLTLLKLLWKL
jgi:hypothetical protein